MLSEERTSEILFASPSGDAPIASGVTSVKTSPFVLDSSGPKRVPSDPAIFDPPSEYVAVRFATAAALSRCRSDRVTCFASAVSL